MPFEDRAEVFKAARDLGYHLQQYGYSGTGAPK
jgi:hypothetical protein